MSKKYYYIIISVFTVLFSSISVFAGETFSNLSISTTPSISTNYISNASIGFTSTDYNVDENTGGTHSYYNYEWSFNNTLTLTGASNKYIYGIASVEYDLYIPNPNSTIWSMYSGVISGEPFGSETVKAYPVILSTTANHYIYRIFWIFDGYNPQGTSAGSVTVGGPEMTISNLSLYSNSTNVTPGNPGVTATGTATNNYTNIRYEDTPLNRGLVGLIASGFDNSIKIDMMVQYLYDIKENDIQYYTDILTGLSQENTWLNSINNWTSSIFTQTAQINTNVGTILTDLENYITFMNDYIPYLQNISTNTLNTYQQLVTIYNYLVNRPTIVTTQHDGAIWNSQNGYTQRYTTTQGRKYVILKKENNIEYIYTYMAAYTAYAIYYYENYDDTLDRNIPTRVYLVEKTAYQYIPIDFRFNENYCIINLLTTDSQNSFKAYIGDGYTYSALLYYINTMENMNADQSSKAAEIESQYNEKESQSESLTNIMNNVTMPTISANDIDILGSIDTNSKSNFFGLIALITHTELVTKIMLIIVTGALVGYIMFGKKG